MELRENNDRIDLKLETLIEQQQQVAKRLNCLLMVTQ